MNIDFIKEKPVKSVLRYGIPTVIGMLLSSIVTIVDGLFIGRIVGKEGIAAVNLGLPMMYIFLGFTIMIGIGGATLTSKKLGERDETGAKNIFNQTVFFTLGVMIVISVMSLIIFNIVIKRLGVSENVRAYMRDYYNIMLVVYPIMMVNTVLGMFLRAEGKPKRFMQISIIANVINISFDYIFICRWNWGIKGAALASLIAVGVSTGIGVGSFFQKSSVLKWGRFEFQFDDLKNSILNGSSELVSQLSLAVTTAVFNTIVLGISGTVGVAAITIVSYVGYVYNMIVTGIGQGMGPIVSFCFGAGEKEALVGARKGAQRIVFICGSFIFIVMMFFGGVYGGVFTKDETLRVMVASGLRIYSFTFLFCGYNIITSFFFTSICKARESGVISFVRGLVLLIINMFLLTEIFGEKGIWMVAPVTEILTMVLSIIFIKKEM